MAIAAIGAWMGIPVAFLFGLPVGPSFGFAVGATWMVTVCRWLTTETRPHVG